MTDAAWASFAINSEEAISPFEKVKPDVPGWDGRLAQIDYQSGKTINPALLPKSAIQNRIWLSYRRFPPLFQVNGYMCVTEPMARFLQQFDLGPAKLNPIELQAHGALADDPSGPYYILGLNAQKQALVPEQSENLRYINDAYSPPVLPAEDYFALRRSALAGPDLWTDPAIRAMFFVSQRLRDALVDEGYARAFKLFRCKMVD